MGTKPRRRTTWTFQPEDDVVKLVQEALGQNPTRGALTKLINAAVRAKHDAERQTEIDSLEQRLAVLKGKTGGKR